LFIFFRIVVIIWVNKHIVFYYNNRFLNCLIKMIKNYILNQKLLLVMH
jgi:hypothetical protein